MPRLLLLGALPFRPLMKTPGLETGCLLLDRVRLSPGRFSLSLVAPLPRATLLSASDPFRTERVCSFWRGFLRGWDQRRDQEGGSQVQIPSPCSGALPCPSRPHPGLGRAEWVGMAQNKKLIKSVSHLHPKIKERERKNFLRQLPRGFLPGPVGQLRGGEAGSNRVSDLCGRPGPGPHPSPRTKPPSLRAINTKSN